MKSQIQRTKKYDLIERTTIFSERLIDLLKSIHQNLINKPIIYQLIRSGTSIGANYMEADASVSRKDFENKIAICRKEAKETMYWLKMLMYMEDSLDQQYKSFFQEVQEFVYIFSAIIKNSKSNSAHKL